jgi:malonate transporter and related proteins
MATMLNQLAFAFSVTGPVLLILLLGYSFHKIKLIDDQFIAVANKLVFNVTLPCLLFLSVASESLQESFNLPLILFAAIATTILTILLWVTAPLVISAEQRGVFVQGTFRGNMGIFGIAMVLNAYGSEILPQAGVYLAVMTILYNLLSIMLLNTNKQPFLRNLYSNPLIIGVLLGLGWSVFAIPLPDWLAKSGNYFAQMSLPLALVCIGGSIKWRSLMSNRVPVLLASGLKLILVPAVFTSIAVILGFKGSELGLLYLMMSAPTAAASFVMASHFTQHGLLAAEIVATTTVFSGLTVSVGLMILNSLNMIS